MIYSSVSVYTVILDYILDAAWEVHPQDESLVRNSKIWILPIQLSTTTSNMQCLIYDYSYMVVMPSSMPQNIAMF